MISYVYDLPNTELILYDIYPLLRGSFGIRSSLNEQSDSLSVRGTAKPVKWYNVFPVC